jgi:hypothetical protein
VILDAQRPVILTSIEDLAHRGDLLDRAILQTLSPIPEGRRRTDEEVRVAFERARPRLLGALLDALAGALACLPDVRLGCLPRMADFALLGVAAERALGWPAGAFLDAYAENRREAHSVALDASPVVPPLVQLAGAGGFAGTAAELLQALGGLAGESVTKGREWPRTARALSGRLRRLAPNLLAVGVELTFGPGGARGRSRIIRVAGHPAAGADGADGTAPTCSCEDDDSIRTPWDDDGGEPEQ